MLSALCEFAAAQPTGSLRLETQQASRAPPQQPQAARVTAQTYRFDIAAQALADALDEYGAVTGRSVFSDASVVEGRTAAALHGTYAPEVALRMLLEGTGLTIRMAATGQTDAFVLKMVDPAQAAATPSFDGNMPEIQPQDPYGGLVQARISEAFCHIPLIAPNDYRATVRFGIDPDGRIIDVRLLHRTADRARDAAIEAALQQIQLDAPPPPGLPQPIYMVIDPRAAKPGWTCGLRH